MDAPIFIVGNPRSGTTLLRLMLSAHPEIVIAPECGFVQWWYNKYHAWDIRNSENINDILEFLHDLKTSKKIGTWNLNYERLFENIVDTKPVSYSKLCERVYYDYAYNLKKNDITFWGDKNNYYLHYLELLYELYPKAYFIIIVRDGRDVACSYKDLSKLKNDIKYKPNLTTEIDEIALEWLNNNKKILNFFQNKYWARNIIIKYEDLIMSSKEVLVDICSFLSLKYDESMLLYYNNNVQEPEETLAWKMKTKSKPDISGIGKYKNILTPDEINQFNHISIELLKYYKYE